ncbi:hypothetical protein MMC24_006759 [Lignoscripta atroalba]|nr:hypothetical protein [Lignoscripta atroalba]
MARKHIELCKKGIPDRALVEAQYNNTSSEHDHLWLSSLEDDEDLDEPIINDLTPYGRDSGMSGHENSKEPYEIARGRYKTITDPKLFVDSLQNPQSFSTAELYRVTSNAQNALKVWQDEYINIDRKLKMIDNQFAGDLVDNEFIADQKYVSKGNPRLLLAPPVHDLRHEEELLGLRWKAGDRYDFTSKIRTERATRGAAEGWLGSRVNHRRPEAETGDEGRRVTRSTRRVRQFFGETSEAETGTSRTPSILGPRTSRKRNFAETDETPDQSDAPRKRGRPARTLLPPSRLAKEVPSGMTTEVESDTATPSPAIGASNKSTKTGSRATGITAHHPESSAPATAAAPPKRKGRPPKALALAAKSTKITKSTPKSKATKSSKKPKLLDEHGKQVNRSKAMTDVWAKRKAEGRNGRHGGPPLMKGPKGKPGRPKKDREGTEKVVDAEEYANDEEGAEEDAYQGLSGETYAEPEASAETAIQTGFDPNFAPPPIELSQPVPQIGYA